MKKGLHVVHICNYFWPKVGGEEKYIYQIAKEQVRIGLKVSVITRNYLKNQSKKELIDGIQIYRIEVNQKQFLRFFTSIKPITKLLKKLDADIYHAHDWNNAMVCKFAKKDYVMSIHGYGHLDDIFPMNRIIKNSIKNAKKLAVNHKFLARKYKKYKPKYIHAGVDLKEYPIKKIKNKNKLLLVSHLSPHRNVELYLEGFKLLKSKKIEFVIAGDGPEKEKMISLGKGHKIKFLGYRKNIPELISKSTIVCGGPLTAIEAMVMGRPCIVAKGLDTELVPEKQIVNTPKEFKNKVNEILNDLDNISKKLGKFARKEYDIKKVALDYQEIYKTI